MDRTTEISFVVPLPMSIASSRGTNPAELPVEFPTKFEMVFNVNTAKALGLEVPVLFRQIADEIVE